LHSTGTTKKANIIYYAEKQKKKGNAILREIDVGHPCAKNMLELSRAQDEEVGDGTTSVIILAGEMLSVAEPLLDKNIHPTVIVSGFNLFARFFIC